MTDREGVGAPATALTKRKGMNYALSYRLHYHVRLAKQCRGDATAGRDLPHAL